MSEQRSDGPGQDEPLPFGLLWAIKRSFVSYVFRMPDGRATVGGGARPVEGNLILFPAVVDPAPADEDGAGAPEQGGAGAPEDGGAAVAADGGAAVAADGGRTVTFHGDVRFQGHAGMLFVRIASPVLTIHGDRAELTIENPFGETDRIPLVTLTLQPGPARDDAQIWVGTDVRLTVDGAPIFNDVYEAGEPFEELSFLLPAGS